MKQPAQPQPEDQIGYLLVRLAHTLSQRWRQDLAKHGLTARQHGVLAALAAQPGISAGALARTVMITAQAMSELLVGLQQRGLVLRRPPSGRGLPAQLTLTDYGRGMLAEVQPITEMHNNPTTLGLTDHDAASLRVLLQRILTAITEPTSETE